MAVYNPSDGAIVGNPYPGNGQNSTRMIPDFSGESPHKRKQFGFQSEPFYTLPIKILTREAVYDPISKEKYTHIRDLYANYPNGVFLTYQFDGNDYRIDVQLIISKIKSRGISTKGMFEEGYGIKKVSLFSTQDGKGGFSAPIEGNTDPNDLSVIYAVIDVEKAPEAVKKG